MVIRWGARSARWAGALGLALACVLPAGRASARPLDEMAPNQARAVDHFTAAGPLADPPDGRLRGYGFSVVISQIGDASEVEYGLFSDHAPAGYKIVVFKIDYQDQGTRDYDRDVKGTVIVDGSRLPVDYITGVIAACIPAGAKQVLFELASAGVAQTFSITEGKRVGPQPEILYRDAAWPDVVTDLTADRVVKARDDKATAPVTIALKRVRLSWFSPGRAVTGESTDTITTPSSPDKAYLIVEGEGYSQTPDDPSTPIFKGFEAVGPSDVHLRLPDGTTVSARHAGETKGLLGGAYYFEVPATLGSATLVVGPASVPAQRRVEEADTPTTARLEAASFKLALPGGDASEQTDGNPAAPSGADETQGQAPRTKPATSRGGRGLPVGLVVLVLAAVGGAGTGLAMRRRAGRDGPAAAAQPPAPAAPALLDDGPLLSVLALSDAPYVALGGPGALAAARAAVATAGANDGGASAAVVLARGDTAALVPAGSATPPWLTVVDDDDALLREVELARVRCIRLEQEAADDSADEDAPPDRLRVVVAVPASFNGDSGHRLRSLVEHTPASRDTKVVVVGDGAPLVVDSDGSLSGDGPAGRVALMHYRDALAKLEAEETPEPSPVAPPAPNPVPVVAVQVLGHCRISASGREVGPGLRKKARELLALLAVQRQGLTADAAMEALWPGESPDGAYFRTVLANLRSMLRELTGADDSVQFVDRTGDLYRLDPARFDVDLWRFEDALAAAARDEGAAAEADDAYGADLLEGADFPWAEGVRERLRRRALDNVTALAERLRASGDLQGALHAAERAVERDPDAEEPYQRVMALYVQLGRPDGARRTYEVLEGRLRELGVTPSDKSRSLRADLGA